jgi:hypothetical protein
VPPLHAVAILRQHDIGLHRPRETLRRTLRVLAAYLN